MDCPSFGRSFPAQIGWETAVTDTRGVKAELRYPAHKFAPEDLLNFIELDDFGTDWKDLGLDDDDLHLLQILIMLQPQPNNVIQGTGGLRKIRFAPGRWNVGKSGAVRVCYVFFPEVSIVLLVTAYSKSEKDNLSAAEKKQIKQFIERQKREFSKKAIT